MYECGIDYGIMSVDDLREGGAAVAARTAVNLSKIMVIPGIVVMRI